MDTFKAGRLPKGLKVVQQPVQDHVWMSPKINASLYSRKPKGTTVPLFYAPAIPTAALIIEYR
jgi:hypothetical protein